MFESFRKKTTEQRKNTPEKSLSFMVFDEYLKQALDVKVIESDGTSTKYLTEVNIQSANWFDTLSAQYPDLEITSVESQTDEGMYYITVTEKQLTSHE